MNHSQIEPLEPPKPPDAPALPMTVPNPRNSYGFAELGRIRQRPDSRNSSKMRGIPRISEIAENAQQNAQHPIVISEVDPPLLWSIRGTINLENDDG